MYSRIESLGQACTAIFQIRQFEMLRAASRRELPKPRESFLFDWQYTPLSAVIALIEAGFAGGFERSDLRILEGRVVNTRFSTSHRHQFTASVQDALTVEELDAQFPVVRSRHDYLCRKMSALVSGDGPVLYVVAGEPDAPAQGLLDALARNPRHRFHVAVFLAGSTYFPLPDDPRISRHEIAASRKPAKRAWEGDDASWLRGFNTVVPR